MMKHQMARRGLTLLMPLLILCTVGWPVALGAQQTTEEPVTLENLLSEALAHNPSLRAAKERWQASTHRIAQAWSLPDPSAGYMIMGPMLETRLGPQKQVYELEQTIPFPGKLWEKRKIAKAESQTVEAAYTAAERNLIRDVSTTYYELRATDASIRAVEEIRDALKKLEQIAQARYATQGQAQRDVAKAQAEVSASLERLFMLNQQRQTLAAHLNALLNRREDTPIGSVVEPVRPKLAYRLEELLAMARESRPELRAAASMLTRDRHASTLAKLEYIPDISVGFQYVGIGRGTTTDSNDGRDAWMVPLKITLPIWQNRIVPAIQEAKRNLNASEASLNEAQNLAEYDVKDRYYHYTTAAKTVELYENALIPEAELAFHSDQAGYEAGRQDALNLLDSERVYLNAKVTYYQALAESLKNFAELERAVGRSLH